MGLDFDARDFLQNLRATKPPYECPVKNCGKIYKSFAGIQFHLVNFNHDGSSAGSGGSASRSQSPQQALTYAEAQRMVELEVEGKLHRINIYDTISLMARDEYEAQYPPQKKEEHLVQETAKTPSSKTPNSKTTSSKAHSSKTPSSKTPHFKGSNKKAAKSKGKEPLSNQANEEKHEGPKLPEATFTILDQWQQPDAPERPKSYYRFIERAPEELEDEVCNDFFLVQLITGLTRGSALGGLG